MQKYRWYILGGFAAVLIAGAIYVSSRQGMTTVPANRGSVPELDLPSAPTANAPGRETRSAASPVPSVPVATVAANIPPPTQRPMILEALKEELFQLELEHKQGKIGQAEYEKAKAALDATLERALKREGQKV